MSMDATALSAVVREMQEANTAGKNDDVIRLLKKLKTDVVATEDLLRVSGRLPSYVTLHVHDHVAFSSSSTPFNAPTRTLAVSFSARS